MALTKITPQMFDTSATAHDLNVDNGTFVVDGSASRVGIGTATPSTLLDVNGALTATTIAGTLTTAAQTNITSVGTLTSLSVGAITSTGNLSVTGQGDFSTQVLVGTNNSHFSENNIRFKSAGAAYFDHNTTGQSFVFRTSNSSSMDTTALIIDHLGNSTIRSGGKLILNRADNATGGEITYGPTGTGFIFNDVNGDDTIFKTGSTEHMRIDAATSRVGIGEPSPGATLHIKGSSGNIYGRVERASASQGEVGFWVRGGTAADYNWYIYQKNNDSALHFYNQSDRLSIDSSGNVGIGTSPSSSYKLTVNGGIQLTAKSLINSNAYFISGTNGFRWNNSTDAYNNCIMYDNGNMYVRGNLGVGTTSPTSYYGQTLMVEAPSNTSAIKLKNSSTGSGNGRSIDIAADVTDLRFVNREVGKVQVFTSPTATNAALGLEVDANGHVTMPKQPYVQGRGNGGWSAFSGSAIWEIQPHGSTPVTSLDRNSDYSTTNKRFTCPVDGVYLVMASWYIYQTAAASAGGQYIHPAVYKNGGIAWNSNMQPYTIVGYEINRSGTGSKHYDGVQIAFTVYCSANDYIDIRAYTPNSNTQSYENYHYFSYTLLS